MNYVTVVGYCYLSHSGEERIVRYRLIKDTGYQKHKPYTWNMKINTSVAIVHWQTGFIISSLGFPLVNAFKHSIWVIILAFGDVFRNAALILWVLAMLVKTSHKNKLLSPTWQWRAENTKTSSHYYSCELWAQWKSYSVGNMVDFSRVYFWMFSSFLYYPGLRGCQRHFVLYV